MSYSNFSSLPPEEEQQFVVFERRSVEASRKAMTIGLISSGLLGLFITVLVLTSDPPAAKHTDALESDIPAETTTPSTSSATTPDEPAPAAAEGEAAAAEGEGEGEAAEGEAAEGEAADRREAPPPPKGATKAPPTALVGE
jgi:hypothetical protein